MKEKISDYFRNVARLEFSGEGTTYPDTFDFAIGDPDLHTDELIINNVYKACLSGDTHYTIPSGKTELKDRIVEFFRKELNQVITSENIQITSSGSHAMYLVLKAILNPGDEVIVFAPYFPNYIDQVSMNGGTPVTVYTKYENSFELNEIDIEKAITNKTKAIIFNTPCNPTGHYYGIESYEILYRVSKRHNLLVIADDIYTNFVFNGQRFSSIASYKDMKERTIQVRSFSKDYLMTGWRIGYIVADEAIIGVTKFINESLVYSTNTLSQNGAIAALDNYEMITKTAHNIYKKRLKTVYDCIQRSKYFDCLPISGTFYIFMDISKTGMTASEFSKFVYEKAHIKVFRGDLFGGEKYSSFVRLAVNLDIPNIIEAFDRLEKLNYKQK